MAEIDDIINEPSEAEKRIKQLSGKVKEQAEAAEAAQKATAEAQEKATAAEKKAQFLEGFSDAVAENPAVREFKSDIEAKVMSGYSMEDATYAVLGKAGKLNSQAETSYSPAGGSATTNVSSAPEKALGDMTQQERRAELENRQGELADILAPKLGR